MNEYKSEEQQIEEINSYNVLAAYSRIPYSLISLEIEDGSQSLFNEINEICKYYDIYKRG